MRRHAPLACLGLVLSLTACGDDTSAIEGGGYPDITEESLANQDAEAAVDVDPVAEMPTCATEPGTEQIQKIVTPADDAAWVAPWLLTVNESPTVFDHDVLSLITGNYPIDVMTVKTVHEVAAGADAFYALHRGGTDLGSEDRQQLTRIETDGSLAWQVDIEDAAAESGISPKSTFMSPSGGFGELTVTESAVQVRVWEGGKRYAYLSFDLTTGEFTEVDDLDEVSAPLFGGVASYGYGPELDVFGNVAEPITAQGFTIAEVGDAIEGVGPNGERWELDADGEPFTCGDTLYVATPEAQLYVLDPTTGEQLYGPVDYSGHGLETSYGPILGVVPEGVFGWRRAVDDDGEDELLLISAE